MYEYYDDDDEDGPRRWRSLLILAVIAALGYLGWQIVANGDDTPALGVGSTTTSSDATTVAVTGVTGSSAPLASTTTLGEPTTAETVVGATSDDDARSTGTERTSAPTTVEDTAADPGPTHDTTGSASVATSLVATSLEATSADVTGSEGSSPAGPGTAVTLVSDDEVSTTTSSASAADAEDAAVVTVRLTDGEAVIDGPVPSQEALVTLVQIIGALEPGTGIDHRDGVDPTTAAGEMTVVVRDDRGVGFDRGVYDELPPRLGPIIDGVAEVLGRFPSSEVIIVGHAVTGGGPSVDQPLSESRAGVAVEALVDRGVDRSRLIAYGAGSSDAVAATAETGINRRLDWQFSGLPIS
ncbi:MAG: OmpA family protein [Desertimonas sp.]